MARTDDGSLPPEMYLAEVRRAYLGPRLLIAIAAFALSCWGTLDSYRDADGDRILGAMPLLAPGLLAGWMTLSVVWMRNFSIQTLMARILFAGFVGAVPVIIANTLFLLGTWAVPANRALIHSVRFHYWWEGSIGIQLVLTGFGGLVGQMCGVLAVALIITLPILSLRNPKVVATGSHLWKVEDSKRRDTLAAYVFCGLGSFILGLILVVPTKGLEDAFAIVDELWFSVRLFFVYQRMDDVERVVWLTGVGFMAGGLMLLAVACGEVVVARIRYALTSS